MILNYKKLLYLISLLFLMSGCKGKEVIGTQAVDFTLSGINEGQIRYSELKGRPVRTPLFLRILVNTLQG